MNISEIKTSGTITPKGGQPMKVSFAEALTPELFGKQSPELQNFICHLASSSAYITIGTRYLELAKAPFPAAMLDFIKWGHSHRRGQSITKLALDAANAALAKLEAEMKELVKAKNFASPRMAVISDEIEAAEKAVLSATSAHSAAEAAKPKKAKAAKAKPVAEMTAEEAAKELAELEGSDDENDGDAEESAD